jgi:hypothetical protein
LKPVYLDFDSPISAEMLIRTVRRLDDEKPDDTVITCSEMLPTPEQAWLTDAGGRRYSAEIRLLAVAPQRWEPA